MITAVEQERKGQICSCCGEGAGDDAAVTSSVGGRRCCCTGSGRSLFLEEKTGCLSCNGQLGRVWGKEDEGRSWLSTKEARERAWFSSVWQRAAACWLRVRG